MLQKSEICFLNKHNTADNEFKPHTHNCYEIIYFVSGHGNIMIGDHLYPVFPDSYCIVPPKAQHSERLNGYGEIIFIGFECSSIVHNLDTGVYHSADPAIYSLFTKILDEYKLQNWGYEITAQALLDILLVALIRNTGVNNKKCKDLDYIKTYIDQYCNQKINFAQLAYILNYKD